MKIKKSPHQITLGGRGALVLSVFPNFELFSGALKRPNMTQLTDQLVRAQGRPLYKVGMDPQPRRVRSKTQYFFFFFPFKICVDKVKFGPIRFDHFRVKFYDLHQTGHELDLMGIQTQAQSNLIQSRIEEGRARLSHCTPLRLVLY